MIKEYKSKVDNEMYFGLFTTIQMNKVSPDLRQLGVRHEFRERVRLCMDELRSWCAFDESSWPSGLAFDLWIHGDDYSKLDDCIKVQCPEKSYIS